MGNGNKKILIFENSNFFSLSARKTLDKNYDIRSINVRFQNESCSKDEHFVHEMNFLRTSYYYQRGLISSMYHFSFNEVLLYRIEEMTKQFEPELIFIELQTASESEWALIHYLYQTFGVPMVAYMPKEKIDSFEGEEILIRLAQYGVRQVLIRLEDFLIRNTIKRNFL